MTATILEQTGVRAIAVHGRTKEQGYSGVANWQAVSPKSLRAFKYRR